MAAEEETDKSPVAMIKEVLVLANAARLIIMTLKAAGSWKKSDTAMAKPAQKFLIFNALLVALVTFYKFTSKMVRPLFVCQMLSHYSCFLMFVVLWKYGDNEKLRNQRKHYSHLITKMHFAYWIVMAVGVKLCTCTAGTIYPISFVMGDLLFFASYFMINKLYSVGIKRMPGEEATLLDDQVNVFMGKYRFMAIWHAIELALGLVFFSHIMKDAVYCTEEDGNKWLHTNIFGALFATMHILGTM